LGLLAAVAVHAVELAPAQPGQAGLRQLVEEAIKHHPSIAAARNQVAAAQAGIQGARAQYYPTPSLQLQQESGNSATVLSLQQPLWAGGRLDAGVEAASARAQAASISVDESRYTLGLRVTAAWGAWLQARGRIESLTEGVELFQRYAQSVRRRIEGGAAGEVDSELVAARLAQTQGDLAAARSSERAARARLAQLVGKELHPSDIAIDPHPNRDTPLQPLPNLTTQAMDHSAALRRREAEITAAGGDLAQKRAALWPTLSLRAQHQRLANPAIGQPASDNRVLVVLEYAPGAGLSAGADIDAAAARQAALRDELLAARQDVADTVATDYEDAVASAQRRQQIEHTLNANRAVLASYDRLFIAGKRGWLDVINAAREVIQTQVTLADASAQHAVASARLRLHVGAPL